jgi:hypothetical protein
MPSEPPAPSAKQLADSSMATIILPLGDGLAAVHSRRVRAGPAPGPPPATIGRPGTLVLGGRDPAGPGSGLGWGRWGSPDRVAGSLGAHDPLPWLASVLARSWWPGALVLTPSSTYPHDRADRHPPRVVLAGGEGLGVAVVQVGPPDRAVVAGGPVQVGGVDRHPARLALARDDGLPAAAIQDDHIDCAVTTGSLQLAEERPADDRGAGSGGGGALGASPGPPSSRLGPPGLAGAAVLCHVIPLPAALAQPVARWRDAADPKTPPPPRRNLVVPLTCSWP